MRTLFKQCCICALGLLLATLPMTECHAVGANDYNPYMREKLPNLRTLTSEGKQFLQQLGGHETSLENEAAYRTGWKNEIYPIVFGSATAPGEIIVLLDFANPASEHVWKAVMEATRSLRPEAVKVVVFGNSSEYFGTDLTGFGIWVAASRPGQAMAYFSHALHRWNEVKNAQKTQGCLKKFNNEYDATISSKDLPIHYDYMRKLKPVVPAEKELNVAKYSYDAGSVNQYQATQVAKYYGVDKLPAVVVNGRKLGTVSGAAISSALQ